MTPFPPSPGDDVGDASGLLGDPTVWERTTPLIDSKITPAAPRGRRSFLRSVVPTAVVVFLLIVAGCEKPPVEEAPVIRPVRTVQVFSTGGSRVRTFAGTTRAGLESQLSFKVSGTLHKVAVKVGDAVEAGAMIARMDATDYEVQAQSTAAQLAQAKASARSANADYERIRGLYENNNASLSELDRARANSESATAQVRALAKQLEAARLQITYTQLKAPVDGKISAVNVQENENVSAGQPIAVLSSGSQPEVEVSVPEVFIAQFHPGMSVKVTVAALPGQELDATVTEVGVAPAAGSATFPVTVRLTRREDGIRPGMAAEVAAKFVSTDKRDRFLVPLSSVGEDDAGRYAYVAEAQKDDPNLATIKRHQVEVGELTQEGLEVFSGLEDGDLVVTAGLSHLTDGMTAKLQTR